MTVAELSTALKERKNVIYNDAEYELHGISRLLNTTTNELYTSILLKDVKANSFVSVSPEMIKGEEEDK